MAELRTRLADVTNEIVLKRLLEVAKASNVRVNHIRAIESRVLELNPVQIVERTGTPIQGAYRPV